MNQPDQMVFPDTSVATVLAIRPLALDLLEQYGINPFLVPNVQIGSLCADNQIPWENFLADLKALAIPDKDSNWRALPISFLLDYLTYEHTLLLKEFFPAIQGLIALEERRQEGPVHIQALIQEWPGFTAFLSEHIDTEQSVLYPKLLRYDHALRHNRVDADFHQGAIKVFSAIQILKNEHQHMGTIQAFLDAIAYIDPRPWEDVSNLENLLQMLKVFQFRLLEHARLETNTLFPMAGILEKKLSLLGASQPPTRPWSAPAGPDS